MTQPGETIRVRKVARPAVHRIRADQLEPDPFFDGDALRVVPELVGAVTACGLVGQLFVPANERDTQQCSKCEAKP